MNKDRSSRGVCGVPRVLLVDEQVGVRQLVAMCVAQERLAELVGEAGGGCEALRIARECQPDVVVVDPALRDLGGIHVLRGIREAVREVRVVVFTGAVDEGLLRAVLKEEPEGFVRKQDELESLRGALRAVLGGGRFLSPFASRLLSRPEAVLDRLSPKEVAVLQMLAGGLVTKQIAEVLDAKPKTVDHHRQHIMAKLGIHDVPGLVRFAVRCGLV